MLRKHYNEMMEYFYIFSHIHLFATMHPQHGTSLYQPSHCTTPMLPHSGAHQLGGRRKAT